MKISGTWILGMLLGWSAGLACAQLQVVPDQQSPVVFGGTVSKIHLVWHNAGDENVTTEIRARMLQTSSATVVPVGAAAWKTLQVLPQQTVQESAQLDFPAVKAETKFLVQWLENSNHILGTTEVWVYPTNLLGGLKPMLDVGDLGVLDPDNVLKPLLRQNGVEFLDLGGTTLEDFRGRLAIIGPFQSRKQIRAGLPSATKQIAGKGVAVVWLQPPGRPHSRLQPSFYTVSAGTNVMVVAQAALVAQLAENPQSQLNLLRLCQLALKPEQFVLPGENTQTEGEKSYEK